MTPSELKAAREALGLSQPALAERLGVSRSAVARWEAGTHRIPLAAATVIRLWVESS